MIKIFAVVMLILLSVSPAAAANADLTWGAPTTNDDDSPLTDLAGYKVYYGTSPRTYTVSKDVGNVTSYTVAGLSNGVYYFAVTAYDTAKHESLYSNEVSKTIAISPSPPPGCAVK